MDSPTIYSVLVLTFLFILSLLGAYVVLRILKGTAAISHRGVQLGGAAAMFVVMFFMLNKYLPDLRKGFIEEAAAAQPVTGITSEGVKRISEVNLRPSTQLITSIDFQNLDRNEYTLEEPYGIAIPKVNQSGWENGEQKQLPIISIADVPALSMGVNTMKAMYAGEEPKVFGVRSPNSYQITLNKNSSINDIDIKFNLFEHKEYFKPVVNAYLAQMIEMGAPGFNSIDDIPEEVYDQVRSQLSGNFKALIDRKVPISKDTFSGVFVMPLSKDFLENSLLNKLGNFSLLDNALTYISLSGLFGIGTNGNLFIDQKRKIVSFNATVRLNDVVVDGKTLDVIINNIGFITAGVERAFFVLLVYSSTEDITVFQQLEKVLNKLRFYG